MLLYPTQDPRLARLPLWLLSLFILAASQPEAAKAQDIEPLRMAAEQGDANAQFNLGHRYDNGDGVPENDREAVRWYRMAAEQGHADSQFDLGVTYANGEGVPKDYVKAYAWSNLAAAQRQPLAARQKTLLRSENVRHASRRGAETLQ